MDLVYEYFQGYLAVGDYSRGLSGDRRSLDEDGKARLLRMLQDVENERCSIVQMR